MANETLKASMLEFHRRFKGVAKEGRNPVFSSRYMTLDGILDTVRPILADVDCYVTQDVTHVNMNEDSRITSIQIRTEISHLTDTQVLSNYVSIPVLKPDAHGVGGALTYGRRYGLCLLLAISADEDLDGNDNSGATMPVPERKLQPIR